MGIHKTGEWTYYGTFHLESWGHGANYGLFIVAPETMELEDVAYIQTDWKVYLFEQALDRVNSERDMAELWQRAFYDDWDEEEYWNMMEEQTPYEEDEYDPTVDDEEID